MDVPLRPQARSRVKSTRAAAGLLLIAALLGACRDPASAALVEQGGAANARLTLKPASVAIVTMGVFVVRRDTIIESAELAQGSGTFELLEMRANFVGGSRPGVTHAGGYPGYLCVNKWPPSAFGASYPAAGLAVKKGDAVAVTAYLRPQGEVKVSGLRLKTRDRQTIAADNVTVHLEASPTGRDPKTYVCNGDALTAWAS
jgi:hypothetical protein